MIEAVGEGAQVVPMTFEFKSPGVGLIAAERARQVDDEGWSAEHDDRHGLGELARAAIAYIEHAEYVGVVGTGGVEIGWPPHSWPWAEGDWKPTDDDVVRMLVKAGALVAAEIDRLQRQEKA